MSEAPLLPVVPGPTRLVSSLLRDSGLSYNVAVLDMTRELASTLLDAMNRVGACRGTLDVPLLDRFRVVLPWRATTPRMLLVDDGATRRLPTGRGWCVPPPDVAIRDGEPTLLELHASDHAVHWEMPVLRHWSYELTRTELLDYLAGGRPFRSASEEAAR